MAVKFIKKYNKESLQYEHIEGKSKKKNDDCVEYSRMNIKLKAKSAHYVHISHER